MAIATRIGSEIYKALPGNVRDRSIYRSITGQAARMLYVGKSQVEVKELLLKKYLVNMNDKIRKVGDKKFETIFAECLQIILILLLMIF